MRRAILTFVPIEKPLPRCNGGINTRFSTKDVFICLIFLAQCEAPLITKCALFDASVLLQLTKQVCSIVDT